MILQSSWRGGDDGTSTDSIFRTLNANPIIFKGIFSSIFYIIYWWFTVSACLAFKIEHILIPSQLNIEAWLELETCEKVHLVLQVHLSELVSDPLDFDVPHGRVFDAQSRFKGGSDYIPIMATLNHQGHGRRIVTIGS